MFLHPLLLFTEIVFELYLFDFKFSFDKSFDFLNWCSSYLQLVIGCGHVGILLNKLSHWKWRIELAALIHSRIVKSLFDLNNQLLELSLDNISLLLLFQIVNAFNLCLMHNPHLIHSGLELLIKSLNLICVLWLLHFYYLFSSLHCSLHCQLNSFLNSLYL